MKSARVFLAGIIDYAGLFPPARLRMDDAVREYARHRDGPDSYLLGRFVLPASRLGEFSLAAKQFLSGVADDAWRLSVIVSPGNHTDLDQVLEFNATQSDVIVDAIEMPVHSSDEVEWITSTYGNSYSIFLEPPLVPDCTSLLTSIARSGGNAKLRTGGVVASAIPPAAALLRFIDAAATLDLRFKATAGLHHAIRGEYPLTYDDDAATGTMFGYLNVFLGAAFRRCALSESDLIDLLLEKDASSISFGDTGVTWRENFADLQCLADTRQSLAVSFGSCSFTEPVEEAKQLHII